ncbi:protein of unknown function [Loktanella fryxellensis]|uniref:DUF4345 domain-containing protein n=1 Tax=Loktanella fryxellensis TaxID=245187 RepID=A0A1H8I2C3_9RHOB|nr:DUF4345 family protein [Loktanella fryxellensis]SEN62275.1 protein of unknown function [Loktanella fryxellensis]
MDILNILFALASIGLGVIGWFAPRYTMDMLDLKQGSGNMGPSEIRAASGALFVGLGVGALLIGDPIAYGMIGCAWTGAAIGRATSLILDGTSALKWKFLAAEVVVGLGALWVNFG